MPKVKKKLSTAQKHVRKKTKEENQKKYMWVFLNGKQVKIKRPPMIEGIDAKSISNKMLIHYGCIKTACGNT